MRTRPFVTLSVYEPTRALAAGFAVEDARASGRRINIAETVRLILEAEKVRREASELQKRKV